MLTLTTWAARWGIPADALADLQATITAPDTLPVELARNEADVQAAVRLEASRRGCRLWRNNVGVLKDERGVPVRFGLANDSAAVNHSVKSADLIGVRPVLIRPDHVGATIGQFVSRECKAPGWRFRGSDRELAQMKWAQIVTALGGDACFANGEGTL